MSNIIMCGIGGRNKDDRDYRTISLVELQTPRDGYKVMLNRYWIVTDECVLFYGKSPQCNTNKNVVDHILSNNDYLNNRFSNLTCVLVPVAYVPIES